MDLAPPEAPQALHSSQNESALSAVTRLSATSDWLATQTAAMPAPSATPATDGVDAFLDELTAYWHVPVEASPGVPPAARATAFAARIAATWRDEATLRDNDGTLDERSVVLIREASAPGQLPPSIRASELMIGDVAYAGAAVLERIGVDDHALLFMPDTGWTTFDSLASLHAATESRLREALVTAIELPGVTADEVTRALERDVFVASRDAGNDIFGTMVERIARVQEQRVMASWEAFRHQLVSAAGLADEVRDVLVLHDHLDVHAMLVHRDRLLADALSEQRLARIPEPVRADWKRARDRYHEALARATRERHAAGLEEPETLESFARRRLGELLMAEGVTDAPDDLIVTLRGHATDLGSQVTRLISGESEERIGLPGLSYRNVGASEAVSLSVARLDGAPLSAPLAGSRLRAIVREADVGTRYLAYLDTKLARRTPAGSVSHDIAIQLQRARMRFELEDSRLSIYSEDEPRAFPHADRGVGYEWVRAMLAAADGTPGPVVDGYPVVVRQVTYAGVPLAGIVEFGVAEGAQGSTSRVVYYTPDAPDGIAFRQFGSRADAARHFLLDRRFEAYLLDCLPAAFGDTDANGQHRFAVSRATAAAKWFYAQSGGFETATGERFAHREVSDLFNALYDAGVSRVRLDVLSSTRATTQADSDGTLARFLALGRQADPVASLAADAIRESVVQTAKVLPALQRFHDNIKAGDHGEALVDLAEAYTSALNVIGSRPLRAIRLPGMAVRTSRGALSTLPTRQRILPPEARFDPALAARDVRLGDVTSVNRGVMTIGEQSYIYQEGKIFRVLRDETSYLDDLGEKTWRLAGNGRASANRQVVKRSSHGEWTIAREHGTRGGGQGTGLPKGYERRAQQGIEPEMRRLSREEINRVWTELERIAPSRETARRIWREVNDGPRSGHHGGRSLQARLHTRDFQMWRTAYDRAMLPASAAHLPLPGPSRVVLPARPTQVRAPLTTVATARPLPPVAYPTGQLVRIPQEHWPSTVWVYREAPEILSRLDAADIVLSQATIAGGRAHGVGALTLPPETPLSGIPGIGAFPVRPGATLGSQAGGWVRVDLHRVRQRLDGTHIVPIDLYSPIGGNGTTFIVRPTQNPVDPFALRDLWLRGGEYQLGTWQ